MPDIYIYDYVNRLGIIQGILLSGIIFFYPGGNKANNKWLALHILSLSIALAAPFTQKAFGTLTTRADRFVEPFLLLIYPFLYLYIRSFTEKIKAATAWLHTLPFLFFAALVIFSIVFQQELSAWSFGIFGFNFLLLVFVLIKVILFIIYLNMCWRRLNMTRDHVKDQFSDISRISLQWIRQLIFGGIGLLVSYSLVMTLIIANPGWARLNFILVLLVTAYLYFASVRGIMQPAIFSPKAHFRYDRSGEAVTASGEESIVRTGAPEKLRYERSKLPEARQEVLMAQLKDLMIKERLFLEPELTIQILGEKLQVSPYYISQVLNLKLKCNFYDFVNHYRVEEAKKLLQNPSNEHFTILSLAFDSGFNSKSTFNAVFKKFTAQTPSAFKSRLDKEKSGLD